uniref:Uncharacterized protein n=1 Tax=Anopheles culicifacies TaxID=139723 RepID=A0A182MDL6_9DIPT
MIEYQQNNHYSASSNADEYRTAPSVTESPKHGTKPHIVDPVWITVTVPPPSYTPTRTDPKPHVMPPYISYVPVPQLPQPMGGQFPMYYPNMPYYPIMPYPYPNNHLCNQQTSSHSVT